MRSYATTAIAALTAVLAAAGSSASDGADQALPPLALARPAVPHAALAPAAPHVAPALSGVQQAALVLEVAPAGNAARYRVNEQLVGLDLPNDAVGSTDAVSGRIAFDEQGRIIADQSVITVDVTGLTSDQSRRDRYVQSRLLRTEEYPNVTLRPTQVRGLPSPLPASGRHTFEVIGDLTILDVTRPTTWQVTAELSKSGVTGSAVTRFTFDDFNLTQPRVRVVLSVADTIALEYDFNLTATGGTR